MATKTQRRAAQTPHETSNTASANEMDETFLEQSYPCNKGEQVSANHVVGNGFRVNVRKPQESGIPGLVMKPIVSSKFVYVDRLDDGSQKLRFAERQ